MRTVNEQYIPLLEETVELIVKCYAVVQHHKLLDSASQVSKKVWSGSHDHIGRGVQGPHIGRGVWSRMTAGRGAVRVT